MATLHSMRGPAKKKALQMATGWANASKEERSGKLHILVVVDPVDPVSTHSEQQDTLAQLQTVSRDLSFQNEQASDIYYCWGLSY